MRTGLEARANATERPRIDLSESLRKEPRKAGTPEVSGGSANPLTLGVPDVRGSSGTSCPTRILIRPQRFSRSRRRQVRRRGTSPCSPRRRRRPAGVERLGGSAGRHGRGLVAHAGCDVVRAGRVIVRVWGPPGAGVRRAARPANAGGPRDLWAEGRGPAAIGVVRAVDRSSDRAAQAPWRSLRTLWGWLLTVARTVSAELARIWARVRFAVSAAKSVSWTSDRALLAFS